MLSYNEKHCIYRIATYNNNNNVFVLNFNNDVPLGIQTRVYSPQSYVHGHFQCTKIASHSMCFALSSTAFSEIHPECSEPVNIFFYLSRKTSLYNVSYVRCGEPVFVTDEKKKLLS